MQCSAQVPLVHVAARRGRVQKLVTSKYSAELIGVCAARRNADALGKGRRGVFCLAASPRLEVLK